MGQIVKRKKKGRPSKADLARRAAAAEPPSSAAEESDVRRSLRRRNVKYTFDFDDYVEDEDFDEEDERRREKKLKVLLKIHSEKSGDESTPSRTRRVVHAPAASASSSESEEDSKPLKKKKIEGDGVVDGDGDDEEIENCFDEDTEVRERRAGSKEADSAPGTPSDHPLGFPLPDKKTLELILDKLQKKDTYGVYAEPVDPEELPDYHDVIEHPMDFGTVRKKLGNGSYTTLEQFESDVLLICSNAMQYNAPDTIYYKQALSIQELAKRKFQRLKFGAEHYEKELKPEQKTRFNSLDKKQIKKPMTRIAQETVASDFSSGATLATVGGLQSGSTTKAGALERLSNVDEYADRIATPSDNNLEKPEDLPSGRGLLSRFGRKPLIHDENRRATYGISTQLVSRPESMFTTFDGEIKQLVAVGLHADHSYARSLARFAGMLGPVAWKVASRRIEQALPPGFKFGRGWVGDYEPLSTPVLMMEKCSQEESAFRNELHSTSDASKNEKNAKTAVSVQNPVAIPTSEEKPTLFGAAANTTASPITNYRVPSKQHSIKGEILEGKNHSFISGEGKPAIVACVNYQVPSPRAKNIDPGKKFTKRVELNSPPPSASQSPRDFSAEKQTPNGVNMSASKSMDPPSRNMNPLFSVPSKQPENNGFVKLPNGKASSNSLDINRTVASSVVNNRSETGSPSNYFPHGQEQGLSDPVQLIRRLTENAQKQQKSSNHSTADNPLVPSSRNDDLNNASSAAARAWMSIGAGVSKSASENTSANRNQIFVNSSHSPTQVPRFRNDFPVSGMQFQPMNNSFPIPAFMAPHFRMSSEAQFQNRPPMVFPQLVTADLSRFQMQSPRHGQNLQRQPSQKQETTVPPDLNIGFQSSGSPGRQSSGVQVDSQQPDLALQL